ncbi:MAG: CapA family protein, partial [Lachnospiraceae bacterium]|nr:CapA family protein [Lachnospiraceae bacterium]
MKTFKKIAPYAALVLCVTLIIAAVVLISNNNKGKTSIPQATTLVGNNSTSEAPTPVPTEEPTTKKPDPIEIDLIAVGDVLTHMPVNNSYKVGDTWNYTGAFAHMTDLIKAADIAVVNQETILGGKELGISGYPNFNAPQELGDYLVAAGFNTVLHATNHTLDRNTTGVLNTINFWET